MIVEDERIVALDIRSMVGRLGYNVCASVPSGEEALNLLEESCPDMVLMDIMLEGELDGIETAKEIRRRTNIPVVYVTAYTDAQTRQKAKESGAADFLGKPVQFYQLEDVLPRIFKNSEA